MLGGLRKGTGALRGMARHGQEVSWELHVLVPAVVCNPSQIQRDAFPVCWMLLCVGNLSSKMWDGMGWGGTGAWSTAGALSRTEIPQQAPGDRRKGSTAKHCVHPDHTSRDHGTARETPGSIRHAKNRSTTLAWAHRNKCSA